MTCATASRSAPTRTCHVGGWGLALSLSMTGLSRRLLTVPLCLVAMARGETVDLVRVLAAEHGVSERTIWRWFAAMRARGDRELTLLRPGRVCEWCGRPLPNATIRRRFCNTTCRVYKHLGKPAPGRGGRRQATPPGVAAFTRNAWPGGAQSAARAAPGHPDCATAQPIGATHSSMGSPRPS